jgi:NitT/TauT family transport system permease protein
MTIQNAMPSDAPLLPMSGSQAARVRRGLTPAVKRRVLAAFVLIALLLTWEGAIYAFDVSSLMFPAPSAVAVTFWRGLISGIYWEHLGVTAFEMLAGLGIGATFGFGFGVMIS